MKKIVLSAIVVSMLAAVIVSCPSGIAGTTTTTTTVNEITYTGDFTITPQYSLWDNASIYFVITDRFYDGNLTNNANYDRTDDNVSEIGTFHGGDIAGLTAKVNDNYFNDLGVTAIWITAPYEQVHGWVVGDGGYKHYAYHGYYPLDFTKMDANMGTPAEFLAFVDAAHTKGIRVIMDVVMNHPGYATHKDLDEFGQSAILSAGWENATTSNYHSFIDYDHDDWLDWWGPYWVRAGLGPNQNTTPDYYETGAGDLLEGVTFLPDFKTEATDVTVDLPPFFGNKLDTDAVAHTDYNVRQYLIEWLTDWVETYGIDGFRCDTARHVEIAAWSDLKTAANAALVTWRDNNAGKKFPDGDYANTSEPFWMVGEVNPHYVSKDTYYTSGGFDALINFQLEDDINTMISSISSIDVIYRDYSNQLNTDPDFNALTYISSHDTTLFFSQSGGADTEVQKLAGSLLMLTPGAVQIFYGDENARPASTAGSDIFAQTRSDYVWGANADVLTHWQKVGKFREKHDAIGSGKHVGLLHTPYTFSRVRDTDKVVCVIGASGLTTIDVSSTFNNGVTLTDFYTDATADVTGGTVTFTADANGLILLEE